MRKIFFKQYLISLGEFPLGDWEDEDAPWLWVNEIFFVLATFLINITILNVLIAIMMETFTKVYANKVINTNKMKLAFISATEESLLPKEQ